VLGHENVRPVIGLVIETYGFYIIFHVIPGLLWDTYSAGYSVNPAAIQAAWQQRDGILTGTEGDALWLRQ
jgi:hypothetical protein